MLNLKRQIAALFVACLATFPSFAKEKIKYENSYNFQRGIEAYSNQDYEQAVDYLVRELEQHHDNAYAHTYIALISYCNSDNGTALTAINKALSYTPKKNKEQKAYNYRVRAKIYVDLGQYSEALADYSKALALLPDDRNTIYERADLYYDMDEYELAIIDHIHLLTIDPNDINALLGLSSNYNMTEDYSKSLECCSRAIALYPDNSSAYESRSIVYYKTEDYSKAAADIVQALSMGFSDRAIGLMNIYAENAYIPLITRIKTKSIAEPNNVMWLYLQGLANESAKKYDLAVDAYKKSMTMDPDEITAYRISQCYTELGDWTHALEYIDKALEYNPDDADNHNHKSVIYWYAGYLDKAIEELTNCIEQAPEYSFFYYRRGWYKELMGNDNDALEDYTTSIVLNPTYPYALMSRGRVYQKLGEAELAKQDLEKCIAVDTIPSENNCAQYAYLYLGQPDRAIDFMQRILETEDKGNYYDAACLYSLMDQKETSLDYLQKALESGYNNINHMLRDSDLDNIRDTQRYRELLEKYASEQAAVLEQQEQAGDYVEKVVEVPFTRTGGVTKVKCTINDLPLQFIFDTGASVVSISKLEATFMYKNDYLTQKDIVGKTAFVDANGDISVGTVINLRNVSFGGLMLENVRASVVENDKAPLLLGQSVLSRLGKVEIDNERSVLKITTRLKN